MAENTSARSATTASLSREQEGEVKRLAREAVVPMLEVAANREKVLVGEWDETALVRGAIAGVRAVLRAQQPTAVLPCDVLLPPATRIGKGCQVSTLMTALRVRDGRPEDQLRFTLRALDATQQPTADIGEALDELRELDAYAEELRREIDRGDRPWLDPAEYQERREAYETASFALVRRLLSASTGSPGQAAQPGAGVRDWSADVKTLAVELAGMKWPKGSDEVVGRAIRLLTDMDLALAPLPNGGESATAAREMGDALRDCLRFLKNEDGAGFGTTRMERSEFYDRAGDLADHITALLAVKSETASVGGRDAE
jgi:hypothetical protein